MNRRLVATGTDWTCLLRRTAAAALLVAGSAAWVTGLALAAPQEKPAGGGSASSKGEPVVGEDGVPVRDLVAGGDAMKRYFLIGPQEKKKAPKEGWGCLVVMPGGSGDDGFNPFVRNIWKSCCPDDFVVVELVAPKWVANPSVIWPMDPGDQQGMKFNTREQLDATLADVAKVQKVKLDPARLYQLAWSSGGPPAYRFALDEKPPFVASYIAMSVFHEGELRLSRAKGRFFFLDHSPDDERCPFADAQRAQQKLTKEGATVELVTYKGGHGWLDNPMARLKQGVAWMEAHRAKPGR